MTTTIGRVSPVSLKNQDLFRQACFVDGAWIKGNRWLEVDNPFDGESVGRVPDLGRAEAHKAIDAAYRAFCAWHRSSADKRELILLRWHDLLLSHAHDVATIMTMEQGKPLREALQEVEYAASYFRWFAGEARRTYGETMPGDSSDSRLTVVKQPVGVVAAVTPWNFPAAMVARKIAPALAAGCTVVLKPSELTPFTALAIAALGEVSGVPSGVINVVTGAPGAIGDCFLENPAVRKLTFTGSTAVGRMLAARSMDSFKRVSLELGGNAPFLVFADADVKAAVEAGVKTKFRNAGQTCISPNRFLVHQDVYEQFAAAFLEATLKLRLGNGFSTEVDVGPLISAKSVSKVQQHLDDAIRLGALRLTPDVTPNGRLFRPTVIGGVTPDMLIFKEETFGPLAGLTRFQSETEALELANRSSSGLAAYVFTRDLARSIRVSDALECGMVGLNTASISSAVIPFGGIKDSGLGREGSRYGIEEYLNIKAVKTLSSSV